MIAALILAGGTGTRLGGIDKAFIPLNGRSLIAYLLSRLSPQASTIAISANGNPTRFDEFQLPVLPDGPLYGKGPLAGIAAGLEWAVHQGATSLITLPVDTPFIPPHLITRLTPAPAVAVYQGRQHHLVAHWNVSDLASLRHFLKTSPPHKVHDFLTLCAARQVNFDPPEDPFLNINTPEDLAAATSRAAQTASPTPP
jgi:molybdopterin-guanine dinucleotide biosynthesis protein A